MAGLEDRHAPAARFATAIDQLHDLVSAQTGASDFGPDNYLAGLRILLLSMDHDPRLTGMGRRIAWGEIYSALGGVPEVVLECVGAAGILNQALFHVAKFGKVVGLGFCTAPDAIIPAIADWKAVKFSFPAIRWPTSPSSPTISTARRIPE